MMKSLFTFLCFLLVVLGQAQTPGPNRAFDPEQNLRTLGNLTPLSAGAFGFDNRYEGVKGTPFLLSEFQGGAIQFINQDTFSTAFRLNVDLIKNTLLVQLRNGSFGEVSANKVQAIQFENLTALPAKWIVASEKDVEGISSVRLKFYGVLQEGKYRLFRSVDKQLKKANFQGAYSSGNTYDEFITEESYWLSVDGKPFEKIKLKRKDIEKALAAEGSKLDKIAKENNLNLNEEQDIIRLLSLLENSDVKK